MEMAVRKGVETVNLGGLLGSNFRHETGEVVEGRVTVIAKRRTGIDCATGVEIIDEIEDEF